MTKELYVSSTPHQTKIALVEDDQLAEVYFEHENEYTLAGSIYKGRVTRVLPGMQSAFVDIGLERDAFLYVSDFYEVEDEEETGEAVPVARPYEVKPEPRASVPDELRNEARGEAEDSSAEARDVEDTSRSENGSDESEGGRRWRGRRRGRRNRSRGFSESKFAHPTAPEAQESGSGPATEPPILPGESLARFRRSEEETEAAQETESEVEAPAAREAHEESREDVRPAIRNEEPPSSRHQKQPVILPGESFAKFNRKNETTSSSSEIPKQGRQESRRQESRGPQSYRPFEPIILPGESISKYERLRGHRVEAATETHHAEPSQESVSSHAEAAARKEATAEAQHPEPPVSEWSRAEEPQYHTLEATTHAGEDITPEPSTEWQLQPPTLAEGQRSEESEEKFPGPELAADSDSSEIYGTSAEEPSLQWEARQISSHDEALGEPIAPAPSYENAPAGAFEEQEIEEDEADLPHPAESLDEGEDFIELEEETFEPGAARAASELADAVQEVAKEREILGGYSAEGENDLSELEEIEQDVYPTANGTVGEENEISRAELRGPAGTAAFQQRAAARPEFDRYQRNRRGGRRFRARRENQRQPVLISDILKEGQEVLIQIAKEPIGKKGARITSHIALPGRFLVYMPTVNHVGVSRKISSDEERQRLKRIVSSERENGHGGFIVRTAAANVSEQELRADIRFLKSLWNDIRTRADNSKAPALIYHDLNLVERTLRDLVTSDFSAIWVDSEAEYERVLRFVNRFQPSLVKRVKLYTKETPLFEQFGIEEEINKALKPKVWLKSGGYIVINQTEALVAIDINTGKYVGKTLRLEDTIFKTNVDACKEIVRQVRLRDLGGIIVIDFIDMDERRNRQRVMQALEEELKNDRAPSKVLQFNDFGLVAITRKRVKQSLERTLGVTCTYCTGSGFIKSPQTVCNEIYTELRKMASRLEKDTIILRVNPEVAKELKADNGRWLNDMEELTGRNLIVKPDATLHQEQFDM
ncbi:MAG TPA: Rne/Rng family ribonuclease [Terriglobales bacterium]|nr:Rne/Rng family ribonuclease [Terriglobales bacterium]